MLNKKNQLSALNNVWPDPDVCVVAVTNRRNRVVSSVLVGRGGATPAYSDDRLAFHFLNDLSVPEDVARLFGHGGVVRYRTHVVDVPNTGLIIPERESYMVFDPCPEGIGRLRVSSLAPASALALPSFMDEVRSVTRSYVYLYDRNRWWVRNPLTPEYGFQALDTVCVSRLN